MGLLVPNSQAITLYAESKLFSSTSITLSYNSSLTTLFCLGSIGTLSPEGGISNERVLTDSDVFADEGFTG